MLQDVTNETNFITLLQEETNMKHICSKNLRKHLKKLKQERNKLYNTVLNGDRPTKQDVIDYNNHKQYVKDLLKQEKLKTSGD